MLNQLKKRFHSYCLRENRRGGEIWNSQTMLAANMVQNKISNAISNSEPLLAGKLGSNEQLLIHWGEKIPLPLPFSSSYKVRFWQTEANYTNAGAKPRTKKSYRDISKLFVSALSEIDILPLFKLRGEYEIWKSLCPDANVCGHLDFLPFMQSTESSWGYSLKDKQVLVVSPFEESILSQYEKREKIWPDSNLLPYFQLSTFRFPYLIDKNALSWYDVYAEISSKIEKEKPEVGLFGCGFLGLLLAHKVKEMGGVGIHMGGALQFLFGIYGERYVQQSWFAKFINSHWVRPSKTEVPKCAQSIESGAYW